MPCPDTLRAGLFLPCALANPFAYPGNTCRQAGKPPFFPKVDDPNVQQNLDITGSCKSDVTPLPAAADKALPGPASGIVAQSWQTMDRPDRIADWDALARLASEPNPFFESWSLLPALAQFDTVARVQILTLELDGQLVGLLPIRLDRFYYDYPIPNWRIWTHHNGFLCAPLVARGAEHVFWRHLLAWADDHAGLAGFLHLSHMPAGTPLTQALAEVLADQSRAGATVKSEVRAMLESTAGPDEYLEASLSAKKRKELRRQRKRLAECGTLATVRHRGAEDLDRWIEDFLTLEGRSWKGAAGSALASLAETTTVFRQSLAGAAGRGRLERLALTLDGQPIAMLATYLTPPGAFSFKTAFDESYSRFSPGVLLQIENLDLLADERIDWCDSCAAEDHPMIDHIWRERRTICRYSIAIGGTLRRRAFAALIRRETGASPGGIA